MSGKMELAAECQRVASYCIEQMPIYQAQDLLRKAAVALRASPAEGEAVAWTNEAQLSFLKEPGYRVVPMAMWAFQHSAHPVALYTAPPRAAVSPPPMFSGDRDPLKSIVEWTAAVSPPQREQIEKAQERLAFEICESLCENMEAGENETRRLAAKVCASTRVKNAILALYPAGNAPKKG